MHACKIHLFNPWMLLLKYSPPWLLTICSGFASCLGSMQLCYTLSAHDLWRLRPCSHAILRRSQLIEASAMLTYHTLTLTTYSRLRSQLIVSVTQMLCIVIDVYRRKEDVLRTEHHCSRLTEVYIIEADSLSWTDSLKRLTLTTSLKQTHWVKQTHWRDQLITPLKQTH